MKNIFNKTNKLVIFSFLFLLISVAFQNCSKNQLVSGSDVNFETGFNSTYTSIPRTDAGQQNVINGNVVLKEYLHLSTKRHFYTSRVSDQTLLETRYSSLFSITGNTITIKAATAAGLSPVYRLFNKAGFHLYTADGTEQAPLLTNSDWQDEGIEGYAIKINPGSTCPSTPSVTYPVYRLFHESNLKYRLVSGANLKAQLIAQGYVDQGILFCATAVTNTVVTQPPQTPPNPPNPGGGGACSWVWADDFAPERPMSLRPALRNISCTSANVSQKQNVTDGSADWTCACDQNTPPPPPPPPPSESGGNSCAFGTTTLANGQSSPGYSSTSVPSGTSCVSKTVTCNNGTLSDPTYKYNSCSPASSGPAPVAGDNCPGEPVRVVVKASEKYNRFYSDTYVQNFMTGNNFVIALDVTDADTTVGLPLATFGFADFRATRGGRYATISRTKCDYTNNAQWVSANFYGTKTPANTVSASVGINGDSRPSDIKLTTGRWYINIQNVQCPANVSCHAVIQWSSGN